MYFPISHTVHAVDSILLLYVPAWQVSQTVRAVPVA
jgi:hypothetical protein